MIKIKTLSVALATPLLLALAAGGASAQGAGGEAQQCRVVVDRSQAPGVFDVTRQVLSGGDCICYVYTGPQPQANAIEGSIASLVQSRSCPAARVMSVPGEQTVGAGLSQSQSGWLIGAAGLVGGIAYGISEDNNRVSP